MPDEVRDWIAGAPVWGQGAIWSAGVNGDAPARENGILRFKIGWYRTEPGRIGLEATLMGATGAGPPVEGEVPDGYGDRGFQPTSINLPSAGCWRFTGTLDTQAEPVEFWVQVAP